LSSFNRRLFLTFPEWDRVQIHNFEEEFNFEETPDIVPEVFLATPKLDFVSELQIEGNPTFVTLNRSGNALVLVNKGHNALEIDPESGRFIQSFPLCGLDSDPGQ
jgi:hypothetical protein